MIGWDYPQPFKLSVSVKATHIDSLGHTNNTVYNRWCEDIAWAHSAGLGIKAEDYHRLHKAMVIQQARYQYLAPSFENDELIVASWLTACDGRLTLQRSFQIVNPVNNRCVLRAQWQLVCISLKTNKPARMPKEFVQAYLPEIIHK